MIKGMAFATTMVIVTRVWAQSTDDYGMFTTGNPADSLANQSVDNSLPGADFDAPYETERPQIEETPLDDPPPSYGRSESEHKRKPRKPTPAEVALATTLQTVKESLETAAQSSQCPDGTLRPRPLRAPRKASQLAPCTESKTAAATYARACQDGDAYGCANFEELPVWDRKRAGSLDKARAVAAYTKACARGNAFGCVRLGRMHVRGTGVEKNAERAAALFKKACDRGDLAGCSGLGDLYRLGDGVAIDLPHATTLYERACAGGDADGCLNLGVLYHNGKYVVRNVGRAAELYGKACLGEKPRACTNLAKYYDPHGGVDPGFLAELYLRGCKGGDPLGCSHYGNLANNATLISFNQKAAYVSFARACCGGDESSCGNLSRAYALSHFGTEGESPRVVSLRDRPRSAGRTIACKDAAAAGAADWPPSAASAPPVLALRHLLDNEMFSIAFPLKPTATKAQVPSQPGPIDQFTWSAQVDWSALFAVKVAIYPIVDAKRWQPSHVLAVSRDTFMASISGKVDKEEPITVESATSRTKCQGLDIEATAMHSRLMARMVVVGNMVIVVFLTRNEVDWTDNEWQLFKSSFTVKR